MSCALPGGTADAYEALRPHLLAYSDLCGFQADRVILRRHGMLAWVRERNGTFVSRPAPNLPSPAISSSIPREVPTKLVKLMACLILSTGKERCDAGTEGYQFSSQE